MCAQEGMEHLGRGEAHQRLGHRVEEGDASVRIAGDDRIRDFRIVASHQESLHSHDAVSVLTEGPTFAAESLDPRLFASLYHVG